MSQRCLRIERTALTASPAKTQRASFSSGGKHGAEAAGHPIFREHFTEHSRRPRIGPHPALRPDSTQR